MLENFGYVLTFLVVGILFVALNLFISSLVRPSKPGGDKEIPYDCGELPTGDGFTQFNIRFYLIAFVFVIFDVEIAFMYPITVVFKELVDSGWGILGFIEIAIFVLILLVGFVYAWTQGGLDWVRSVRQNTQE